MSDLFWMAQAYELALKAEEQGEIPVGAVLVSEGNNLLGSGWNQVLQTNDPCAHAELFAIRSAAATLNNYRLLHTTLYVTLEPCPMCAGALVHARIGRLVFATRDFKAGAAGSVYNLLRGYPLNHQVRIDEGIMQEKCAKLLADFFKIRR
ncbi:MULTISPECIES: tRNA adenosine(34) deaminase TadA [Legionella]|uniref:tRNA-specific adenosine deaminase n=1 Tax=Legionella maceachernii TaxID=466 RepID=A0A0W0WE25_9GAMM|nr:tRNA adenosine(34) deaminase TadA [Legionella maceachernii]KTD30562.1 tRNA-specific adenosine deaminase [Legionella maceachernii]SJZ78098.1 tRNA(adenine34) deaminase [Legionella maceachernii]SUP02996.1 tRNA-specific adenosine deaminase [Legionella maceachernii]